MLVKILLISASSYYFDLTVRRTHRLSKPIKCGSDPPLGPDPNTQLHCQDLAVLFYIYSPQLSILCTR